MPVTYRIDKTQHLVVCEWSGVITMEEARAHNAALRSDPDFDPTMRLLSDAREAQSTVSTSDLELLARGNPFGALSQGAVVVASDLVFGVSRQYEQLRGPDAPTLHVFRDIHEARKWLGVTET